MDVLIYEIEDTHNRKEALVKLFSPLEGIKIYKFDRAQVRTVEGEVNKLKFFDLAFIHGGDHDLFKKANIISKHHIWYGGKGQNEDRPGKFFENGSHWILRHPFEVGSEVSFVIHDAEEIIDFFVSDGDHEVPKSFSKYYDKVLEEKLLLLHSLLEQQAPSFPSEIKDYMVESSDSYENFMKEKTIASLRDTLLGQS